MAQASLDGRYRLIRLLGRGGMGEVWQAHDDRIGRAVAVKIVTAAGLTDEALARFDREARIIGNLSGPSIVTVHDYGHDEYAGEIVPYLVMELVAGRTIAAWVHAGGPVAPRTALEWARQVCAALAVAHLANVVHRDIKPSNVMVTDAGLVKVLDFGIARFVGPQESGTGLTATGMAIGTVEFMSPEQAQGEPVDARSDLYSLGCLLYFTLVGRGPFAADTPVGLALQHVSKAPDAPGRHRQGIPPEVDALVLALLAKDPRDRPADAQTVGDRIRDLLTRSQDAATVELPVEAPGDTEHDMKHVTKHVTKHDTMPLPDAGGARTTHAPIGAESGLWAPTQGYVTPGTRLLPAKRPRRWFLSAAAAVTVGGAGVGTWLAVGQGSKSPGSGTAGHGSGAGADAPTSSPTPARPVVIARLSDQKAPVNHVAFSPDSKILVTAAQDDTARLYDVSDPTRPATLSVCAKHTAMVFDAAFSPDGGMLATSSHDQSLGLWDIRAPRSPRLLAQVRLGDQLTGVRFSPDGTLVAVGTVGGSVRLIDVRQPTGTPPQWTLTGHSSLAYSVAFSPDGKTLATSSFDKTVKLWDVRDPAAARLLGTATGHTDRVFDIAYHPGGGLLAAGSGDRSLILFDVSNPADPSLSVRLQQPDEATGVAFSPNGRIVANGGGASSAVRLYDITTPASPRQLDPLSGTSNYALGVAFSPDGKLLACACADQDATVLVWRF